MDGSGSNRKKTNKEKRNKALLQTADQSTILQSQHLDGFIDADDVATPPYNQMTSNKKLSLDFADDHNKVEFINSEINLKTKIKS